MGAAEREAASVSAEAFFDAARALKREQTGEAGVGLTQVEVDAFNAIIGTWKPKPADIPDDYWDMLAGIESGHRPYVKAPTSSASGLYQFIRQTWIGEGGTWGNDMSQAFGGLKPSEEEQLARAMTFTAKNADYLVKRGVPINKASLYAAHFLGAGTAAALIAADIHDRADLIAGEAATNANRSILKGKTVADFLTWLHTKTGDWAR
jgi:hypothetical protein